jgi:23S rRNA (uracil1939-C5)-methyltransferase
LAKRSPGRHSSRRRSKRSTPKPERRELRISHLGRRGDGIAEDDTGGTGGRVFVPFALPGEVVEADVAGNRGKLRRVIEAAPARVTPPCPLFGQCGGCAMQHLEFDAYRDWKYQAVTQALANKELDVAVDPLIDAYGQGRRRVTLHAGFDKDGAVHVGFMRPRSHALLDIAHCLILEPAFDNINAIAARFATPFADNAKQIDLRFTATDTGLDCDVRGAGRDLSYEQRVALADAADDDDLARISVAGETIAERRKPVISMGSAKVTAPPGGFLQATAMGEQTLADLVMLHAAEARRVADLFCGVGPFALRLAQDKPVHALDTDHVALAALDQALRFTPNLKPLSVERRDLFDNPLMAGDLKDFDTVIFDPPRSGAEAQAEELAESAVTTIIAVSCEPATFARDAAILVRGGYTLQRVTPVDQFKFAAHVEMVGVFRRG